MDKLQFIKCFRGSVAIILFASFSEIASAQIEMDTTTYFNDFQSPITENTDIYSNYANSPSTGGAVDTTVSGNVNAGQTRNILNKRFFPEDIIRLENTGNTRLKFCISSPSGDCSSTGRELMPKSSVEITANELVSDSDAEQVLNVTNRGNSSGAFKVNVKGRSGRGSCENGDPNAWIGDEETAILALCDKYKTLNVTNGSPAIRLIDNEIQSGTDKLSDLIIASDNGAGRLINNHHFAVFLDADNNNTDETFQIISNSSWYGGTSFKRLFLVNANGDATSSGGYTISDGTLKIVESLNNRWTANGWRRAIETPLGSVWKTAQASTFMGLNKYLGFGITSSGWYWVMQGSDGSSGTAEYPMYLTFTTGTTPQLNVCGNIQAKKIRVASGWCDFVFEENFVRLNFEEKELFYKKHKHLPNIPPASEIETNGLDLSEVMKGMMQNIEEDRLDITELYKRLVKLEEENKELKKKIDRLKNSK
jgi:hypothetical protein